jgi:hypothetical protein
MKQSGTRKLVSFLLLVLTFPYLKQARNQIIYSATLNLGMMRGLPIYWRI